MIQWLWSVPVYNHHHCQSPEHGHHPKREIHYPLTSHSPPPTPPPPPPSLTLATTNLLSSSLNLPILNISEKCNPIHYVAFFGLASFIWRNVFKVHLCCSVYHYFIPFYG